MGEVVFHVSDPPAAQCVDRPAWPAVAEGYALWGCERVPLSTVERDGSTPEGYPRWELGFSEVHWHRWYIVEAQNAEGQSVLSEPVPYTRVPEPGAPLLLAALVLGLVGLARTPGGRRRRQVAERVRAGRERERQERQ